MPGYPKSWTRVKVTCDKKALYVLYNCREVGRFSNKAKGDYSPKVSSDDHVSLLISAGETKLPQKWLLIKINPNSTKWVKVFSGSETDCNGTYLKKLDGLEAKAATYHGRWVVELRLPFASVFKNPNKMPALWKANFFRKRTYRHWSNVRPGYYGYSHWYQAWKQSGAIPYFQPHWSLFGWLYIPTGKNPPARIRNIKPGIGKKRDLEKTAAKEKEAATPLPGFNFSQQDLNHFLKAPTAFVRHVKKDPEITGNMTDPIWDQATPLTFQYMDLAMPETRVHKNSTLVHILTDDKYLYMGFRCHEDFITDISVNSGAMWRDDTIDIFIDPGRTQDYKYAQLSFNTQGKINKSFMKNDNRWKPKSLDIKTGIHIHKKMWTAELKISFRDLGISPGSLKKLWGANFYRVRWARRPSMNETPG